MHPKKLVLFIWTSEEVTWVSDETFPPLKTLHPDEQNQLFEISLSGWPSMDENTNQCSFLFFSQLNLLVKRDQIFMHHQEADEFYFMDFR